VARRFLDKLDARTQAEFGVDVGEVGLHVRGETKSRVAMSFIAEPFADQSHDVMLGRSE
jgi:hypothetical protein